MTAVKPKKKSVRLWAVVFWLLVWQGASMALAALYPPARLSARRARRPHARPALARRA